MRNAEKQHMNRVAELGCILCKHLDYGSTPAHLHHIREGQGMSQRASNFLVVPLCPEHHQGGSGIHGLGEKGFYTRYKLSELDLLAMTLEALYSSSRQDVFSRRYCLLGLTTIPLSALSMTRDLWANEFLIVLSSMGSLGLAALNFIMSSPMSE